MTRQARIAAIVVFLCISQSAWAQAPGPVSRPTTNPSGGKGSATAPLGAANFIPSADRPVGWRGDGTGRYTGANPPTAWAIRGAGGQGVVWACPMPNVGVSCPIVVGNKVFLTCEASDLVCIDKTTGKILWIRSNPAFEGLSAEENKANPEIATTLAPFTQQLATFNETAAAACNSGRSPAGQKTALDKQIDAKQTVLDKKLFGYNWGQAVFGFAGCTPTSDGKFVYAFFANGNTVCYDLDGKRKWIAHGGGDGAEHGNFASPLLIGGQIVVWANQMRSYDALTGKAMWSKDIKGQNTYGSLFRIQSGGDLVACFQSGYFVRIRDGVSIWGEHTFGDSVMTPVVEGGVIFAGVGADGGVKAFPVPGSTNGGRVAAAYAFKANWGADEMVIGKGNPFDRSCCASPLVVDKLLYRLNEGGGLLVNDAATGNEVYHKVLPMKSKTSYWTWAGASVSPTLAGKYIYLMDNQGTCVVIQPGNEYKEVAKNMLEESAGGREQAQILATPFFEGTRMYMRTPGFLYCIGK